LDLVDATLATDAVEDLNSVLFFDDPVVISSEGTGPRLLKEDMDDPGSADTIFFFFFLNVPAVLSSGSKLAKEDTGDSNSPDTFFFFFFFFFLDDPAVFSSVSILAKEDSDDINSPDAFFFFLDDSAALSSVSIIANENSDVTSSSDNFFLFLDDPAVLSSGSMLLAKEVADVSNSAVTFFFFFFFLVDPSVLSTEGANSTPGKEDIDFLWSDDTLVFFFFTLGVVSWTAVILLSTGDFFIFYFGSPRDLYSSNLVSQRYLAT
jgi:hypothetical protein